MHQRKHFSYFVAGVFLLMGSFTNLYAADTSPFYTGNASPLISIYGLPFLGESAVETKQGGSLRLTLDLANNYLSENNSRERLLLDGESCRLTFSGRYGIGRKMDLGFDIPFLVAGGGFLDNLIENYHSTFGFPNGGREYAPQNRLLYRYQKNGVTVLNMEKSGQGFGDMVINGGRQIYQSQQGDRKMTFRASLKFPTGDTDTLRGSGSTDLALWMTGSLSHPSSWGRLTVYGGAGALGMTKGKVLQDQQRPLVGFGSLGLGFCPAEWIELKVQTNAHTSFYTDSDFTAISGASAQLTVGGALHFTPKTSLDIGVTEDIIVGASPDVVLHLSLKRTF
jgi:hypothetical protein